MTPSLPLCTIIFALLPWIIAAAVGASAAWANDMTPGTPLKPTAPPAALIAFKKARRSINPSLRLFTLSSSQSKSQKCICSQTCTHHTYTYSYINILAYNLIDNGDISNGPAPAHATQNLTKQAITR